MLVEQPKQKVTPLLFDSYLTVIKNSIGSNTFRTLVADMDGEKKDLLQNGQTSCAFFVSSVLLMFQSVSLGIKLISEMHTTVLSTVKDLKNSGWIEIGEPKAGCILVWKEIDFNSGGIHNHIGFFIGNGKAISNSEKLGHPIEHNWDYDGKRKVELMLWNPRLE